MALTPYEYSLAKVLLCKECKSKFPIEFIASNFGEEYQTVLNIKEPLSAGTYYIMVEIDWKFS